MRTKTSMTVVGGRMPSRREMLCDVEGRYQVTHEFQLPSFRFTISCATQSSVSRPITHTVAPFLPSPVSGTRYCVESNICTRGNRVNRSDTARIEWRLPIYSAYPLLRCRRCDGRLTRRGLQRPQDFFIAVGRITGNFWSVDSPMGI